MQSLPRLEVLEERCLLNDQGMQFYPPLNGQSLGSIVQGQTFQYNYITARDPGNHANFTFSVSPNPYGASFNPPAVMPYSFDGTYYYYRSTFNWPTNSFNPGVYTFSVHINDMLCCTSDGSFTVQVTPAMADHFVVSGFPNGPAWVPHQFTVTAYTIQNTIATNYRGTVHFASTDGQAALPVNYTFTAGDNGAHTFTATLKTPGSQMITATDTVMASIRGTQSGISVQSIRFAVNGFPMTTTAGDPHSFTVTAQDLSGNRISTYTGTVHLSSSDPTVPPSNYPFVAGDNGMHTFNVMLKTAGTQSLTATDTVNSGFTGSETGIQVNPASTSTLLVSGFPPTIMGVQHSFSVAAKDAYGNTTPAYRGTVRFNSSDTQAVLPNPNPYTFTAGDNGVHTFTATLNTRGTQSITATDTMMATITGSQTGIMVESPASSFVVAGYPTPQGQGDPGPFTVTAKDASGNIVTAYTGTVHFSSSDPQAVLPPDYTFTPADQGMHTFSATFNTLGTQSLTATDTAASSITGTQRNIVVALATTTTTVFPSSLEPARQGRPVTFTATVAGNQSGHGTPTGMVTFMEGSSPLGPPVSLTNGVATFTATSLSLGHHAISAHYQGSATFGQSTSPAILQSVHNGTLFAVGGNGLVQVRRTADGSLVTEFAPYGTDYTGPISVAVGDVNGDGYDDLVTGATVGNPDVRVYDGKALATGMFDSSNPGASLLAQWFPYGLNFNVGANVAVGDVSGNGYDDVVTGASAGNPDVRVFSGKDIANGNFDPNGASLLADWFPYAIQFNVGANVAAGDVNHDGYADVVTGATVGNPDVRVYSGKDIAQGTFNPTGSSELAQFFAYGLNFNVGALVAVGDTTGDGFGDIITGASAGNPDVHVYDGTAIARGTFDNNHPENSQIDEFFAYQLNFDVGAAVAAADFEGNGKFDILTGSAEGSSHFRVVQGNASGTEPPAVFEDIPTDLGAGIYVGA